MSLGIVLDVAIGLVFAYLLMAIIVSGLIELIAGWAKWRPNDLRKGIAALLGADTHPVLDQLFNQVFQHGLIAETSAEGLPSYVPSRNFALALADILKQAGGAGTTFSRIQAGIQALPSGTVKQTLSTLVSDAAGDADVLQKRIETWFDDAMDRATGAYKRSTQLWMLAIAFVAAVVLNVDSIALARSLWNDPAVRNAMVASAQSYAKEGQPKPCDAECAKAALCELNRLPLPIGWTKPAPKPAAPTGAAPTGAAPTGKVACTDVENQIASLSETFSIMRDRFETGSWLWMLVGWALTAMAVSFGAPFWFDALKNLLNVRSAGPKPPRAEAKGANP